MPIRFKSRHAPDILMLEAVARELIGFMGHSGSVPGAFAPEDLPVALAQLRHGLARLEHATLAAERRAEANADEEERDRDRRNTVSAAHRAAPLLAMLESAIAHGDYVMWDQ
jgi:hypothetical protein